MKKFSTIKKIGYTLGGAVVLLIVAIVVILGWEGSTKDIVAVADKFQAPSSWKLESEMIRPPKIACFDGGTCPEVDRTWSSEQTPTKADLDTILKQSGWSFSIDGNCTPSPNAYGSGGSVCHAEGVVDNFNISIYISDSYHEKEDGRITLSVRPH